MRFLANYKKSKFRIIGGELVVLSNMFIFEPTFFPSENNVIKINIPDISAIFISKECYEQLKVLTTSNEYDFVSSQAEFIASELLKINSNIAVTRNKKQCKNFLYEHPVISWFLSFFVFYIFSIIFLR